MLTKYDAKKNAPLVGKIVFFMSSLSRPTSKPYLVVEETKASIKCRPARLDESKNANADPAAPLSRWSDITIADFEEWNDIQEATKRKSGILYVADALEEALPLYNASCRYEREIEIARRLAMREWKENSARLLGCASDI